MGWAATQWSLGANFWWFTAAVALACLAAGVLGLAGRRPRVAEVVAA